MNLEILLSISCLVSNHKEACMSMGKAYYYHANLDEISKNIEKQYPAFVFTASLLSSIEKRKASVPIYGGTYFSVELPGNSESKLTFGFSRGF